METSTGNTERDIVLQSKKGDASLTCRARAQSVVTRGVVRTRHGRIAVVDLFGVVAIGESQGLVKTEIRWRKMQAGSTSLQVARENWEGLAGRQISARLLAVGDGRRDQSS